MFCGRSRGLESTPPHRLPSNSQKKIDSQFLFQSYLQGLSENRFDDRFHFLKKTNPIWGLDTPPDHLPSNSQQRKIDARFSFQSYRRGLGEIRFENRFDSKINRFSAGAK